MAEYVGLGSSKGEKFLSQPENVDNNADDEHGDSNEDKKEVSRQRWRTSQWSRSVAIMEENGDDGEVSSESKTERTLGKFTCWVGVRAWDKE